MPISAFKTKWSWIIDTLVAGSVVLTAKHEDENETILGWICVGDSGIVHYIHVRKEFQKMGIGKRLLDEGLRFVGEDLLRCSHWTVHAEQTSWAAECLRCPWVLIGFPGE